MDFRFTTSLKQAVQHTGLVGGPGSGKTAFAQFLILQHLRNPNARVIAICPEGDETRILPLVPGNMAVFHPGNYRFNPVAPVEEASTEENAEDTFNAIASATWMGIRTYKDFQPRLVQLNGEMAAGQPRGLHDFIARCSDIQDREIKQTLIGKLQSLDHPFFRSRGPLRMSLMASANCLFLIPQLPVHVESAFVQLLLARLLRYKQYLASRCPDLIHIFAMDEVQRYLSTTGQDPQTVQRSPAVDVVNRGRKFNLGLIWVLQRPSVIEPSFLKTGLFCAGNLDAHDDLSVARSLLNFTSREQFDYFRTIKPRNFLVKVTGSTAFPVRVPDLPFSKIHFSPQECDEVNKEVMARTKLPLDRLFYHEEVNAPVPPHKTDEKVFMEAVNNNPCYPVTRYYSFVKPSYEQQKAAEVRDRLISDGYLKLHKITTGGKGECKGLEITPAGYKHFDLKPTLIFWRGTDYPTTWMTEWLRRHFAEQGAQVRREVMLGNHPVDLLVDRIGVEVSIGTKPTDELKGICADLAVVEKVIVVCNNLDHLRQTKNLIPKDLLPRVEFRLFAEFLSKDKKDA